MIIQEIKAQFDPSEAFMRHLELLADEDKDHERQDKERVNHEPEAILYLLFDQCGRSDPVHFDLLPVDFLALAEIVEADHPGHCNQCDCCQVENAHVAP